MAMRGLLALFFLAAPLGSNGLRRLAAPPRPRCAAATMQERQWLNVNGERVVTATKKKKSTKAAYLNKKEDGPLSDALGEGHREGAEVGAHVHDEVPRPQRRREQPHHRLLPLALQLEAHARGEVLDVEQKRPVPQEPQA